MFSNFNENWYQGLFWSEELIGNDDNCIQGHFYDATVSKMGANKIEKLLMVSDFNENAYLGVFWSEEFVGNDEICIQDHFHEATIFKMAANKIVKLSMVSDFDEHWYLGVFWSEELVGALHSDRGSFGDFCVCIQTQSNLVIIIKSPNEVLGTSSFCTISYYYYYYYYSSSSSNELVRTNSQRLMIRSLLNFTGKWIPISRGAFGSWNFQNCALPWKPWTNVKIFDLTYIGIVPKGFPQDLAYILSRVGTICWPKKSLPNGRHF
jgi:hypothetical protein